MLSNDFIGYLENELNQQIIKSKPISGGDISEAYYLKTETKEYLVKTHSNYELLNAETVGLNAIANTNTIATPKAIDINIFQSIPFLILEWIDTKSPNSIDFSKLGNQLADLHKCSYNSFGFESNNFIGSLHQRNSLKNNWNDFYIEERLIPQMQLAIQKGLLNHSEIPSNDQMKSVCFKFFKGVKPSLLHGDLWSGNYLISSSGKPYLIDPSVYYGHSEIDIAMSKLFGGFGQSFYDSYHRIIPKDEYTDDRIQLYQMYYLLVHLNLFGSSYYSSVKQILRNYF